MGPKDMLELIRDGLGGAAVADRTEFPADRFDLVLAIGAAYCAKCAGGAVCLLRILKP
jgi:hypothetical protein